MDLTIPTTFYPSTLPLFLAWGLFVLASLTTLGGTYLVYRMKSAKTAIFLSVPIAIAMLLTSVFASMIITFFLHDL